MRGEGLAREGEFSVENLAFKVLRNMGYLDKIRQAAKDAEDDELTLEDTGAHKCGWCGGATSPGGNPTGKKGSAGAKKVNGKCCPGGSRDYQSQKSHEDEMRINEIFYNKGDVGYKVFAEGDRVKPFELVTYQEDGDVYVTGYDNLKHAIAHGRDGMKHGELGFKVTNPVNNWGEEEVYHSEGMTLQDGALAEDNGSVAPTVEEVGAMYEKYKTNDWQNRGGNYPKSGVPDAVDNAGSYGDEAFIEFSFKNTSESQAKSWVQGWLKSKNLPYTKIDSGQDGDYKDDWVIVYVTYKLSSNVNEGDR